MRRIAVVTDSTSSIPQEMMDSLKITMVPIHLMIGDKEYRDVIDIPADILFRRMREEGILPTTSGSVLGEFVEIFEGLKDKSDGIVAIVLPPELPSTGYSSALRAADMMEDMKIEVVDSRWSFPAQGFVALAAARAAAQGANLETVAKVARETSAKMNLFFVPEDLKYWKRLGRFIMPGTEEDWEKVNPILTMRGGKIVLEQNCSRGQGVPRMIEIVKERARKDSPLHLSVFHAGDPDKAEKIKEQIVADVHCDELIETMMSPVVGIHTGPGTLGVAFYNE